MIESIKKYLRENSITKKSYLQLSSLKLAGKNIKKRNDIQKNGIRLMKIINDLFDNADICYFFDFGTLLGIIRENRLLGHDLDVDIGVFCEKDTHKKVRHNLLSAGFKLVYEYMIEKNIVEESYVCFDVKVDINYYSNRGAKSVCYLLYRIQDKKYEENILDVVELTCDKINAFQEIDFNGILIKIPEKPELLLEQRYGVKWKIPDKSWIYWKGPSAKHIEKQGLKIVHL